VRTTCPTNLILLDLTILIIFYDIPPPTTNKLFENMWTPKIVYIFPSLLFYR
jgi:hypothetical protein